MVLFIKSKMNAEYLYGIIDHIDINLANNRYINTRYTDCIDNIPSDNDNVCLLIFYIV